MGLLVKAAPSVGPTRRLFDMVSRRTFVTVTTQAIYIKLFVLKQPIGGVSAGTADKPDNDLEQVFADADDPVLSAVEVAKQLGITQQAAHSKLAAAADRGEMNRKKVGARAVVWWPKNQEFPETPSA